MSKAWSRGEVLTAVSILVPAFIAVSVPEIRRCIGFDSGNCPFWNNRQVPSENLETGTYFAEGTIYNNSRREVVRVSDRTCISLVQGPANNYEGHETVTISSLSWRNGSFYLDATDDRILISSTEEPYVRGKMQPFSFRREGERSLWLLKKAQVEKSQEVDACLASQDKYVKRIYRKFVPGKFKL